MKIIIDQRTTPFFVIGFGSGYFQDTFELPHPHMHMLKILGHKFGLLRVNWELIRLWELK